MFARLSVVLATFCCCSSCQTQPAGVKPGSSTSEVVPSGQTSAGPAAATIAASAAPTAQATTDTDDRYCVSAKESQALAKPQRNAAPPYEACAKGILSHCGGGRGEEGHLCSLPLDTKRTELTRKTKPDSCCYRGE